MDKDKLYVLVGLMITIVFFLVTVYYKSGAFD